MIRLDNGERSFTYWRSVSAARRLAEDRTTLETAFGAAKLIYLTGITLAILEPDDREKLLEALAGARSTGAEIALDTNFRPLLWAETTAEAAKEAAVWIERAAALASIVLPSLEEERAHFGPCDAEAAIDRYVDAGARTVVVKDGSRPILAWDHDEGYCTFAPIPVVAIDTTAAGDSFNGAFLAARVSGASLVRSVGAAAEIAGQVIRHRGALIKEAVT